MSRTFYCLTALAAVGLLVSSAAAQPDSTDVVPPQDGDLRVVPTPGVQADGKLLPEELERRLRERLRQMPAEISPPSAREGSRTRFLSTDEAARIHFQAADDDEDGRLTAEELERLPATIRELLEARLRRNPDVGLKLEDVRAALVLLDAESQPRREPAVPADVPRGQAEPLRGNLPRVIQEALQDTAEDAAPPNQAITVQIVLLGRFSEEVPVRTLGADVLTAIGDSEGEVPGSLVGRLLPWVGAEENSAVKILEAMQGGTVAGDQVRLQTGTQPTGTMATLQASVDGNEVWVKAEFEKSFLPQAHRSNSAQAPGATPWGHGFSSSHPGMPATNTLQATGTVRVTPGRPVILTEVLQQSENGVQEYVVLVDAAIESD